MVNFTNNRERERREGKKVGRAHIYPQHSKGNNTGTDAAEKSRVLDPVGPPRSRSLVLLLPDYFSDPLHPVDICIHRKASHSFISSPQCQSSRTGHCMLLSLPWNRDVTMCLRNTNELWVWSTKSQKECILTFASSLLSSSCSSSDRVSVAPIAAATSSPSSGTGSVLSRPGWNLKKKSL